MVKTINPEISRSAFTGKAFYVYTEASGYDYAIKHSEGRQDGTVRVVFVPVSEFQKRPYVYPALIEVGFQPDDILACIDDFCPNAPFGQNTEKFERKGVGSKVLHHIIQDSMAQAKAVLINPLLPKTKSFVEKHGFTPLNLTPLYYNLL